MSKRGGKRKGAGRPTIASQKKRKEIFLDSLIVKYNLGEYKNDKDRRDKALQAFALECLENPQNQKWFLQNVFGDVNLSQTLDITSGGKSIDISSIVSGAFEDVEVTEEDSKESSED